MNNKVWYIALVLLFFLNIQGVESHTLYEQADDNYYGVWETEKGSSIKTKIDIGPQKNIHLYINDKKIENARYDFIYGTAGYGSPYFEWENEDDSIIYELYFILGKKNGVIYARGFYHISHVDIEGRVLKEFWYELKLYKLRE